MVCTIYTKNDHITHGWMGGSFSGISCIGTTGWKPAPGT